MRAGWQGRNLDRPRPDSVSSQICIHRRGIRSRPASVACNRVGPSWLRMFVPCLHLMLSSDSMNTINISLWSVLQISTHLQYSIVESETFSTLKEWYDSSTTAKPNIDSSRSRTTAPWKPFFHAVRILVSPFFGFMPFIVKRS